MKRNFIGIAVLAILVIPAICFATPPRPGPYASVFLGVSIPEDMDVTTTYFGDPQQYDDRVEFDPGIFTGGTAGFDFGYVRLEGEISYRYSDMDSITAKTEGFEFNSVDGNLGVFSMMANAWFDFHNASLITPYWGGGIGFAVLDQDDTYVVDPQGGSGVLYPGDDDTVFAYQLGVGIEIALNPMMSLDIGYRYFGTSDAKFNSDPYISSDGNFESHNAVAALRVNF